MLEKIQLLKELIATGQLVPKFMNRSEDDLITLVNQLEIEAKKLQQPLVSGSLLPDVDYWKQRCLLAEKCIEESPCDPDITADQIKAWNAYHKFISWYGNDR